MRLKSDRTAVQAQYWGRGGRGVGSRKTVRTGHMRDGWDCPWVSHLHCARGVGNCAQEGWACIPGQQRPGTRDTRPWEQTGAVVGRRGSSFPRSQRRDLGHPADGDRCSPGPQRRGTGAPHHGPGKVNGTGATRLPRVAGAQHGMDHFIAGWKRIRSGHRCGLRG